MSDTSATNSPIDQPVEELGADPVAVNSDGASSESGPVMVVGATDDASADQIAQEVQNTNPTQESSDSIPTTSSDIPTDTSTSTVDGGVTDGTDALGLSTDQTVDSISPDVSGLSGDASEIVSSPVSSDESQTPPSKKVDSDGETDGDASGNLEDSVSSSSSTTSGVPSSNESVDTSSTSSLASTSTGIQVEDVPNTSASSTESEDGSTLGDVELPVESIPQEPFWPAADELPDGVEAVQVEVPKLLNREEIHHRFGFHKAAIEGPQASNNNHKALRHEFTGFAEWLNDGLPAGRETDLMFTALEEASMWAHKAIAKNDPLVQE